MASSMGDKAWDVKGDSMEYCFISCFWGNHKCLF